MLTHLTVPAHLTSRALTELQAALAATPAVHVELDLTPAGTLGTAALRLLVDADRRLRRRGGGLHLTGCSPRVQRVLAGAGLGRLLSEAPRAEAFGLAA